MLLHALLLSLIPPTILASTSYPTTQAKITPPTFPLPPLPTNPSSQDPISPPMYPFGQPYPEASHGPESHQNEIWKKIQHDAHSDGIDLTALPFAKEAIESIARLAVDKVEVGSREFEGMRRVDVHTHPIPNWFRALELNAAGRATPSWSVQAHLDFMSSHQIAHSVLCVSTPQANAFLTERNAEVRKRKTLALARLLNCFTAELCHVYPERFSWMAVLPLPHVDEAIVELKRWFGDEQQQQQQPVGVGVLTNHEGLYPGDATFDPLWGLLQKRAREREQGREIVFVHPTEPVIRLADGSFVNSTPSPLRSGLGEFYFETARAVSSLTAFSAILNFPLLHWRISHGAGAFPDISERFLLGFPNISSRAREAYKQRFWYDSAGPVWPNQVKGLTEGMGIPVEQMVFGTDFPYGIGFWDVDANIRGLAEVKGLSDREKEMVFWRNAKRLWEGRSRGLDAV